MILEYQLPLTSKRADVVLAGRHPRTGNASYVVVELEAVVFGPPVGGRRVPRLVEGMPGGPKLHPARQVRGYCEYVTDFVRSLTASRRRWPAGLSAQRHRSGPIGDLYLAPLDHQGQLFTGADRSRLHAFLRSRLDPSVPGADAADELLGSAVAPSKQLLAVAADEVREREQFVLQDDQQLAVDIVKHEVDRARRRDRKSIVVVSGGPGSGKSVIALSLLGELARRADRLARHRLEVVHPDPAEGRWRAGTARTTDVQVLQQFMDADRNGLDVLILDEAHRIRETSVDRYTRAALRTDDHSSTS